MLIESITRRLEWSEEEQKELSDALEKELSKVIIAEEVKARTAGSNSQNAGDADALCIEHKERDCRSFGKKENEKVRSPRWRKTVHFCLFLLGVIVAGFACYFYTYYKRVNRYEELLSCSQALSVELQADIIREAVRLFPEDFRGYDRLLEIYEDESYFDRTEGDRLLRIFDENGDSLSVSDRDEFYRRLGKLYLFIYSDDDSERELQNKLIKSSQCFEKITEPTDEDEEYKSLGIYYKKYVLSSGTGDLSADENLEEAKKTVLKMIEKYRGEEDGEEKNL